MTTNKEVLVTDPTTRPLPNDGVAKVGRPQTTEEWRVLEWELGNFVCDGEYAEGLVRVLSTYLQNLENETQPAAWVSGFYGSGKSHFVKVLEYLWTDHELPSGARPRGLVTLPDAVSDELVELTNAGKREGGLWAASGKLSGGAAERFRLSFLGILLSAAGLPTSYPQARLVLWLHEKDQHSAVEAALGRKGTTLADELQDMYVSTDLRQALIEAIPSFANDDAEARQLLREQYPAVDDVSEDEVLATARDVLKLKSNREDKLPCTVVVLDELQQFISDDPRVMLTVGDLVEKCSGALGSNLLFLGTGQSALKANPTLARFQDRFTVTISLEDADIEDVVRKVVLQKKPDQEAAVAGILDSARGEIDRHLQGTKIEASPNDEGALVPDYPILPTRRRFWELALRAVDQGGAGLLRSQLRSTHEAARRVADLELGNVVGADFIYEDHEADMQQSAVLSRGIANEINKLDDGTNEGALKARICRAIFLITQLPREEGADSGLRATPDHISDLLVTNLNAGSADLRHEVAELLGSLASDGTLMKIGDEYRLQTPEGQEWERDFQRRETTIRGDGTRLAGERTTVLRDLVGAEAGRTSVRQGQTKTARKTQLEYGEARPEVGVSIPVWVRDGWSVTERTVRVDAGEGGTDDPTVYVFIPKRSADEVASVLSTATAAAEVVESRVAGTEEGYEARRAMEARRDSAVERRDALIHGLLGEALVLQGGGTEVAGETLAERVEKAADAAVARMYPRFLDADHPGWGTALRRAGDGNASALEAVGHEGEAKDHPVCKEVLEHIGAGKKGNEVIKKFMEPPFGWPKDGIQAALMTLLANEEVTATADGVEQTAKQLTVSKLGVTNFRVPSGRRVRADEKLAVRSLCQELGVDCPNGEEVARSSELIRALSELARDAGGEPPLPAPPDDPDLERMQTLSANERTIELAGKRDGLSEAIKAWRSRRAIRDQRLPHWERLGRLLSHTDGDEGANAREQMEAIRAQRTLLEEPDPVAPLLRSVAERLRGELQEMHRELSDVLGDARSDLEATEGWTDLSDATKEELIRKHQLQDPPPLDVGTEELLLGELDRSPLAAWRARIQAVPKSLADAMLDVARELQPETRPIKLPRAQLDSAEDVEAYLESARKVLEKAVSDGPVMVS